MVLAGKKKKLPGKHQYLLLFEAVDLTLFWMWNTIMTAKLRSRLPSFHSKHQCSSNCSSLSDEQPFGQQSRNFCLHQLLKSDQFVLWGWKIIRLPSDVCALSSERRAGSFHRGPDIKLFWWYPSSLSAAPPMRMNWMQRVWTQWVYYGRNILVHYTTNKGSLKANFHKFPLKSVWSKVG